MRVWILGSTLGRPILDLATHALGFGVCLTLEFYVLGSTPERPILDLVCETPMLKKDYGGPFNVNVVQGIIWGLHCGGLHFRGLESRVTDFRSRYPETCASEESLGFYTLGSRVKERVESVGFLNIAVPFLQVYQGIIALSIRCQLACAYALFGF